MGFEVADRDDDADLGDAAVARRNESEAIAVGIDQLPARFQPRPGDEEFAIAARRDVPPERSEDD